MRRPLGAGKPWLIVLGCIGIALLPTRLREGVRGKLLDLSLRAGRSEVAPASEREGELESKIRLLEAEKIEHERALDELRGASEITAARTDLRLIPAEAFPLAGPGELVRRILLGRGEREGIAAGQPVLAGSALVGFVAQAARERSEVRLVTDPAFLLRVTAPRAGIEGMLGGSGAATLTFVPAPSCDDDPGTKLQPGDVLVVSRASTVCTVPAVVGTVREVKRSPGGASSVAVVVPAAPLAVLTRVVAVRSEGPIARAAPGDRGAGSPPADAPK